MSANVYHPSRGGVRGGKDQFNWDDVKSDKDRECYLGHSVKAPVGRWQKGKDLVWYTRGKDGEMSEAERRKQELRSVKEMEAHAMAAALGYKVPQNPMSKDDAPKTTESEQTEHTIEGSEKKKNKRKKEKHAKKKKKHKRKYSSSGDEENENDRKRRKEKTRKRDRASSDSCEDDGKIRHRDTRSDVITDRQSQNERPKKRRSIDERDVERNDRHSKKEKYRDRCIDSNGEEMYSSRTQKQDGNDPRRRKGDRSEGRHSEERDAEDRNSRRRNDDERDFNNRKRENRQRDNYREEDGDRKRRRADRRDGD